MCCARWLIALHHTFKRDPPTETPQPGGILVGVYSGHFIRSETVLFLDVGFLGPLPGLLNSLDASFLLGADGVGGSMNSHKSRVESDTKVLGQSAWRKE